MRPTVLMLFASVAFSQGFSPSNCAAPPSMSASGAGTAGAQWDNSGNGMLLYAGTGSSGGTGMPGVYNFRYVQYTVGDSRGDLSHAMAAYGTITFSSATNSSGSYTYTVSAEKLDSDSPELQPISITSSTTSPYTYSIGACGFGFLSNPFISSPSGSSDLIWGMVSKSGVFIGSSTDTQHAWNDLFIAAPVSTATPSFPNQALNGGYSVAYINFPGGNINDVVTAGFQMAPNGRGGIGNLDILMYQGPSAGMDVVEPASYYFSKNGIGVLGFPTSGFAIARPKYLYESPDGNFIFGGDPQAFDLFFGVKTISGTSAFAINGGFLADNFSGLYYQVGIDEIYPAGSLQTYYGSFEANSGTIIDHQRILAPLRSSLQLAAYPPLQPPGLPYQPFNYTYADASSVAFGSSTGYTDATAAAPKQYVLSADGSARLGFGMQNSPGISIALQAPDPLPASDPPVLYIDPACVLNGASFAPYSAGLSPGEPITITVTGSVSSTDAFTVQIGSSQASAVVLSPVPQMISRCSPGTQGTVISAIVPQGVTAGAASAPPFVQIQVSQGSQSSNIVSALVYNTTPGVPTLSGNGLGDAVACHQAAAASSTGSGSGAPASGSGGSTSSSSGSTSSTGGSNGTPNACNLTCTNSSMASTSNPSAPQITQFNPATQGETIILQVEGLGVGGLGYGAASTGGSCSPVAPALSVTIGGIPAPVQSAAMDSVNTNAFDLLLTVPAGVTPGDVPVVVASHDGTTAQATLPVIAAPPASKGGN